LLQFENKIALSYNRYGIEMKDEIIKKIPYGVTDYEAIKTGHAYYVDKTSYIKEIEKAGKYLFFIRPRRFGKSLFLSMLESYYDIAKKEQFELFYKGTDIFNNPTKERNSHLILKFNFSAVNPGINHVERSFTDYIKEVGEVFVTKYKEFLQVNDTESIKELKSKQTASDVLRYIISFCKKSNQTLYVIIDEYDNFANTILSESGSGNYIKMTHSEVFFRAFFNVLKEGTTGSAASIARVFLTGVSPITMDDVTSGYNIGKNISIDPVFNEMLGFTRKDVVEIIEYYKGNDLIKHSTEYLTEIMNTWYNNYTFSTGAQTTLFNPDMVLYFLDRYMGRYELPGQLIDRNVRIDYRKLRHLIMIDSNRMKLTNGNFSRLKQIIEDGGIESTIVEGFPVDKVADSKNFISLLFYFGLLTIKGVKVPGEKPVLRIPNEAIKRLYYDYIHEAYEETGTFSLDYDRYEDLMGDMAYQGEWVPLFKYIALRMKESMSLRDLITGEKSIQAFLNVYLGLSQRYIVHVEKELNKGFADIVMEPFKARFPEIKYAYLIEIKYMKKVKGKKAKENGKLQQLIAEAKKQLSKYSMDSKFEKSMTGTNLIKLVLVFTGIELVHIEEVK